MPGDGEPLVLAAMEVKRLQAAALVRLAVAVAQAARTAGATQYATSDGERGTVGELDADGSALTRLIQLELLELVPLLPTFAL